MCAVIIRVAAENDLQLLDLRSVCSTAPDYAKTIEPSSRGGEKIASAILEIVTGPHRHLSAGRLYAYK